MKNILVTGGCGFIGSNFIRYVLGETGFKGRIINVDKLTYAGNLENLEGIESAFKKEYIFINTDICDKNKMADIFHDYQIDTVCHFAAESHVDRSIIRPEQFIYTNIIGTFNLLELFRTSSHPMVLFHHVSTDEVYGSLGADGYFTEETPYSPNSPYSASKASSDHLVRAYHKTYGIPVTISNCSNNYGPYQFPEKLIPLMTINAMDGKPLPVYGDGKNVRDWLFVKDHCKAVWLIMSEGKRGATYNIGGGNELENVSLVEMICDIVGDFDSSPRESLRELIVYVKDRPGHDHRYAIDFSRLENELGWSPEESFESGLRKTIAWYIDNRRWTDRVKSGEYRDWIKEHYAEADI
jgi:dTDP-glucose 4,6-dehydratase